MLRFLAGAALLLLTTTFAAAQYVPKALPPPPPRLPNPGTQIQPITPGLPSTGSDQGVIITDCCAGYACVTGRCECVNQQPICR
jgi:hypothetical protein